MTAQSYDITGRRYCYVAIYVIGPHLPVFLGGSGVSGSRGISLRIWGMSCSASIRLQGRKALWKEGCCLWDRAELSPNLDSSIYRRDATLSHGII